MKHKISAMKAAGIGCALMSAIIGFFVFTTPTEQFIDYLTTAGELVGGKTMIGAFMLALLPPLTAMIFYYLWKYITK